MKNWFISACLAGPDPELRPRITLLVSRLSLPTDPPLLDTPDLPRPTSGRGVGGFDVCEATARGGFLEVGVDVEDPGKTRIASSTLVGVPGAGTGVPPLGMEEVGSSRVVPDPVLAPVGLITVMTAVCASCSGLEISSSAGAATLAAPEEDENTSDEEGEEAMVPTPNGYGLSVGGGGYTADNLCKYGFRVQPKS